MITMKIHPPHPTPVVRSILASVGLASLLCVSQAAPYIDNFSSTDNITTFGNVQVSAANNILTASRSAGDVDSGFNWRPGGSGLFSMATANEQFIFSMNALVPVGSGQYNITALFFDGSGNFLSELGVQADTAQTGIFDYDMASIGAGVVNAEQWFPRVRITVPDSGFEFQNFQAVPEPSTYALLALAGIAGAAFWRRKRS
jgi:hypothetical protein